MNFLKRLMGWGFDADPQASLLRLIQKELNSCGDAFASDFELEGGSQLMGCQRRFAITVKSIERNEGQIHGHISSWLPSSKSPTGADELDACIMDYGDEVSLENVARYWLQLVGAPVISCLKGQAVLAADHFDGSDPWGVPGGHGFVGPVMVRGEHNFDMEFLSQQNLFEFDGYPRDQRSHLVKATLIHSDGRWTRHLEIDGHTDQHVDEDWQGTMPSSDKGVVCLRFAVFNLG